MNPALLPVLNLIIGYFQKRKFFREQVMPLIDSAGNLPDAAERRALVIKILMEKWGLPESSARFLVEKGVQKWKKILAKRAKKAAKKASKG